MTSSDTAADDSPWSSGPWGNLSVDPAVLLATRWKLFPGSSNKKSVFLKQIHVDTSHLNLGCWETFYSTTLILQLYLLPPNQSPGYPLALSRDTQSFPKLPPLPSENVRKCQTSFASISRSQSRWHWGFTVQCLSSDPVKWFFPVWRVHQQLDRQWGLFISPWVVCLHFAPLIF